MSPVVIGALAFGALCLLLIALTVIYSRLVAKAQRALLEKLRTVCRNLGLDHADDGWVGRVEDQRVVTRLWQMPATVRTPRTYLQTLVCVEPSIAEALVVFSGASHPSDNQILPWVGTWTDRPLPRGGTYQDTIEGRGEGPLYRVELGRKDFDRWFYVFAEHPERVRALLEGSVADAMVAAASPVGNLWFDGANVELLLGMEAPGTLTEMIRAQRALAGQLAATLVRSGTAPWAATTTGATISQLPSTSSAGSPSSTLTASTSASGRSIPPIRARRSCALSARARFSKSRRDPPPSPTPSWAR